MARSKKNKTPNSNNANVPGANWVNSQQSSSKSSKSNPAPPPAPGPSNITPASRNPSHPSSNSHAQQSSTPGYGSSAAPVSAANQRPSTAGPSSTDHVTSSMNNLTLASDSTTPSAKDISSTTSTTSRRQGPSTATNDTSLPEPSPPSLSMVPSQNATSSNQDPKGHPMLKQPGAFLDKSTAGLAARPGFANPKFSVWTNYLRLGFKPGQKLYVYEIDGINSDYTRPKQKVLVDRFIHKSALLSKQQDNFVTDSIKKIVAFKDLSLADGQGVLEAGSATALVKVSVDNHNAKSQTTQPLDLKLVLKQIVSLDKFSEFCSGQLAQHSPDETYGELIAAVNLLISKEIQITAGNKILLVGTNKVYTRAGWEELYGHPKLVIRGYAFGMQAGMGSPLLNVNPITTVFHKTQNNDGTPMTVKQYVYSKGPASVTELQGHLKGVRVWLTLDRMKTTKHKHTEDLDRPGRRIKTIAGFGLEADKQTAYDDTKVWDHMKSYYFGQTNGNERSLCVNLGGEKDKQQWFLADDLVILPYQPFRGDTKPLADLIITKACRGPSVNRNLITHEFVPFFGMQNGATGDRAVHIMEKQGLKVHSELESVQAHNAIDSPVLYGGGEETTSRQGQWKLTTQRFLNVGAKFQGRAFFLLPPNSMLWRTDADRNQYLKHFYGHYHVNGVEGLGVFNGLDQSNSARITSFTVGAFQKLCNSAYRDHKADLVVLILPKDDKIQRKNYANFKIAADQLVGIKSLCLNEDKITNAFKVHENVQDGRGSRPNHGGGGPRSKKVFKGVPPSVGPDHAFAGYVRNVAMKLNVRLGNDNHSAPPEVFNKLIPGFKDDQGLMIIGADVVHPGHTSHLGTPSIAAVVGTIDSGLVGYRGSARRQPSKTEIIADMQAMVEERLRDYHYETNFLPSSILYYRDGIDDGQWTAVRDLETAAIRQAFHDVALEVDQERASEKIKVTTVIVSKRHHTRFYPKAGDKQIPNGNCLPGTVVDSGVCLPYNYDFYLLSHNAIKGTARPAHYIVLENDIGFEPEEIQGLTNVLCSTYARSTTAVSYVPAAYYADHLCERVKQYMRPLYDCEDIGDRSVQEVSDELWARGGRPDGNPWSEYLDSTMFWI